MLIDDVLCMDEWMRDAAPHVVNGAAVMPLLLADTNKYKEQLRSVPARPPFPVTWVEYGVMDYQDGTSFRDGAVFVDDPDSDTIRYESWCETAMALYADIPRSDYHFAQVTADCHVPPDIDAYMKADKANADAVMETEQLLFTLAGLTLKLFHVRGVEKVRYAPPERLQRARIRRKKPPLVEYQTILFPGMDARIRHARGGTVPGTTGVAPAHLVRGHFAHYTPDSPLFGTWSGTVWRPLHVRGKAENGVILKEYEGRL